MLDLPAIIGHRGAAAEAPENTLASIRRAHESGARMVEFDVKLTREGVPILIHDERLERTTNGRGPVRERTIDEIRALDAGSWFDARFAGERIPTLEEAALLCLDLGLGMNVEIKPCAGREVETATTALETLRRSWPAWVAAPLVSSFAGAALQAALDEAPDWPRGYLATKLPADWQARVRRLGCTTVHLGLDRLTRDDAAAVVGAGRPLLVYTVNDRERARYMFALGVRSIITDRVHGLRGVAPADQ